MKVTVVPWSAGGSADAYKGALRLWAMVAIAAVLLATLLGGGLPLVL